MRGQYEAIVGSLEAVRRRTRDGRGDEEATPGWATINYGLRRASGDDDEPSREADWYLLLSSNVKRWLVTGDRSRVEGQLCDVNDRVVCKEQGDNTSDD